MAKFVKSNVKTVEEFGELNSIIVSSPTRRVEIAGRTCYDSFSKINNLSDISFCENMIKSGHHAMIEFATAIIKVDADIYEEFRYSNFKFLNMSEYDDNYLISGNMRAWRDFIKEATCSKVLKEYLLYILKESYIYGVFFFDFEYDRDVSIVNIQFNVNFFNEINLTNEEKKKHQYFHFVLETDRGVMAEITRHRTSSFAIRSTRYVSYKDGAEFIFPYWYHKEVKDIWDKVKHGIGKWVWKRSCSLSENGYKWMIRLGFKPQDARAVLPNSLKTVINISGNLETFEWIFHLRSAKSAHPDIRIISDKMKRYVEMYK